MEISETVKRLDDEVKVIKNEIQAVLLDIREAYLNPENPFNPEISALTISSTERDKGPAKFEEEKNTSTVEKAKRMS